MKFLTEKRKAVSEMSRISDQIRAYVDDPTTAEHYGAWGILRPDQRRLIRNLCDICDMYERTADLAVAEREANVKGFLAQVEELNARCLNAKKEAAKQIFEEIETLLCYSVTPKINANGTITSVKSRDYCIRRDDYTELQKKYCGEDTNVPTKVKSGDICVICGEPVPEGRQVCKMCEVGQAFLDKKKE